MVGSTPTLDLQVNGFLGIDFSGADLTEEHARRACREYLRQGADRFLVTLITSPIETYRRNLPLLVRVMDEPEFRDRIPGLHLEGPFISSRPGAVGAHPPACVQAPDVDLYRRLQEWAGGRAKLITLAAELPGADKLCRAMTRDGVTVALGHQLASVEELDRLYDAGAKALTHLGNGMPNEVNRHDNPLLNGLVQGRLVPMLVGDGHHLPVRLLRWLIEQGWSRGVVVVSDASALAGMPPGRYETMGNAVVIEEDGLLHNPIKKCLVGSSFTLRRCAALLTETLGLDAGAVKTVVHDNPARLVGCLGNG